jgi:hypothetical protein
MRVITSVALVVAAVTVPFAIMGLIALTLFSGKRCRWILLHLATRQRYQSVMTRGVLIFTGVVYFPLMCFYLMLWLLAKGGGI